MEDPERARRLTAGALAAVALLCGGCGGSSTPDSVQVRKAVLDYARAFGSGNGKKACGLLTAEGRAAFMKLVAPVSNTSDCATAVARVQQVLDPRIGAAIRTGRVADVRVQGSAATATLVAGAQSAPVRLAKRGGRWLLLAAPGVGR